MPLKPVKLSNPGPGFILTWTGISLVLISLLLTPLYDQYINLDNFDLKVFSIALLPVVFLFGVAFLLTGRWLSGAILVHGFLLLFLLASAKKQAALLTPLLFEDLSFLYDPVSALKLFSEYVSVRASKVIILSVIILSLLALFRYEKKRIRLLPRLGILLVLVILTTQSLSGRDIQKAYQALGVVDMTWNQTVNQERNGFYTVFSLSVWNIDHNLPKQDKEIIRQFAEDRKQLILPLAETHPDIIFYLSESLFDPAILTDYEPCDVIKILCQLPANTQAGAFAVPTYGGGTTKTEFAVLTGVNPLQFNRQLSIPYRKIMHRQANSIAWELKALGYRTIAIHPNDAEFYSRNVAIPNLGFDEYISAEQFTAITAKNATYINDIDLDNKIFESLKHSDQPVFIMAISIENHGPWGQRKIKDENLLNTILPPVRLTAESKRKWQEYLYHVHFAERSLLELLDYVKRTARPTTLLFFGDHLPGLTEVFAEFEFDDGKAANRQDTFYIYTKNFGSINLPDNLVAYQVAPAILNDLQLLQANYFYDLYRVYFELDQLASDNNRETLFEQAQLQQLYWQSDNVSPQ